MAIILKGAARSEATATTLPVRSTTVKILQTGLIDSLVNEQGSSVGNVNLGYMGDNKVSRIYVELWKNSNSFVGYDPALVFYNTKTKTRNTIDMQKTSPNFSVDVPEAITLQPEDYQIYFILRENLSTETSGSTAVGSEDDPAYREVFVSDVFKGKVDAKSGRQYISTEFDWNTKIHNYNIGTIAVDDKTWEGVGNSYSTELYLGGLKAEDDTVVVVNGATKKATDVNITYDSEIINSVEGTLDSENKTLTVTTVFTDGATEEAINNALDQIIISYPVNFSATYNNSLKTPIKVVNTANSLEVENNKRLGMKHDAYITPIDVSGLIEPRDAAADIVYKYTIFEQNSDVYVCKATNNYCWIPIGITSRSGNWNVSFVVRNETKGYSYYTGVLNLPVTDNALFKEDIMSDSTYSVVLDSAGSYLYDDNGYVIYAQSEEQSSVPIGFTGTKINDILGWADGVASSDNYDNTTIKNDLDWVEGISSTYTSQNVKDKLSQIEGLSTNVSALQDVVGDSTKGLTKRMAEAEERLDEFEASDVSEMAKDVEKIQQDILTLQNADTAIRNEYKNADAALKTTLEQGYKAADTALNNLINSAITTNSEQSIKIAEHGGKIASLEAKDIDLQGQIGVINTTLSNYGTFTSALTQEIENRVNADRDFKEQLENIYVQDEFTKVESGLLIDKETQLRSELEAEVARAKGREDDLYSRLDEEEQRAVEAENKLQQDISTEHNDRLVAESELGDRIDDACDNIDDLYQKYNNQQTSVNSHTTSLGIIQETLNTSVVRNNYEVGVDKTYVASIVFIKPDTENNLTAEQVYEALVAAGQIDNNTLYLIQEEE